MLDEVDAVEPDAIRGTSAFNQQWYYSLELAPGVFTSGADHLNIALTRELLRHVDVERGGGPGGGARCLDIGTMEGLIPILLGRRRASEIVAYDRILRHERLALVRQTLKARFDLLGDMKLADLPEATRKAGYPPFDVVIFSGVLYHLFDPLAGLAIARGLVRNGGIMIVETRATFDEGMVLHFNARARIGPWALWTPSVACLDYLLRFCRLDALDLVYLAGSRGEPDKTPPSGRVGIACRAVPDQIAEPGDEFLVAEGGAQDVRGEDFSEHLDWEAVESTEPPVGYETVRDDSMVRKDGIPDLAATLRNAPARRPHPDEVRLKLGARH